MSLLKYLKLFKKEEDGAVTVDWVVLTAAIVGLAVALIAAVLNAVGILGATISTDLATYTTGM